MRSKGGIFLGLGLAGLALHAAAGVETTLGTWTYSALMVGAAGAVLLRAARVPQQRLAWGLIGGGLAAWAAGDIYYDAVLQKSAEIPYPSLSDGLYFVMYAALLAGLGVLHGRRRGETPLSSGIVVSLLGLATIWSLLVLDKVVGEAEGSTMAVATTVAYPLLDLALLMSTALAFAARNWRFDRVIGLLSLGFLLLAVADSFYATAIAEGSNTWGVLVDSMWPAGAMAIAAAAWTTPKPRAAGPDQLRALPIFAASGAAIAAAVLIVDHFDRFETITVVLAGLTLLVACVQLVLLSRERTRARTDAATAEALRSASTEAALDCIVTIDAKGIVREWNAAASRVFGYSRQEAIGRELAELIVPEHMRARHRAGLARAAQTGQGPLLDNRVELVAQTAHGTSIPVELAVTGVQADPPMFTGFLRDISERRRREEENERLAAIVRTADSAILARDLDGLVTAWNEGAERLYGYSAEEAIGQPLASLIVPPDRREELTLITQRVLQGEPTSLETQRHDRDGNVFDVSLRILPMRDETGRVVGVSATVHDLTDRLRREERDRADREGRLWRRRIEDALQEERLAFWGQPVVDAANGAVDHHELLLRLRLGGETILPGRFLPHVEQSALMTAIDRWAVRSGAALAQEMPVAINLSAKSIGNPILLAEIEQALVDRRHAERITFELTETAAARNLSEAHDLVAELVRMGCSVALDDFGTGYGSFTYLKRLPVTELKIDIEFVRGLAADEANQRIVRSLVSVAENFGMRTVAEGVEDEQTLQLLVSLGVDMVQGYYIGRPGPIRAPSGIAERSRQ